ncbi:hypothetical protein OQX61_21595 [Pedobacter sp. PLR]|uniref:hypothetical protein n=1 Tax=Pedobacter sp. PLR TaxID=2994465 RepID=UPI002244FCFC|nr:hypothetical protein [Pedobacter sp. PLR]MCX2453877.1 hypothetical protein [Pedobacter sp. PLR]
MKNIVAVNDKKQLASFIDFPHDLYKNDSNYVPELFIAQQDMLTPGKHPFHEHSTLQLYLAYEGDKIIGRIAAIQNNNHNNINKTTEGHFGFFDCINDQQTAQLLVDTAAKWLKERNMTSMIGPVNFSTNDICALLIEGFDGPPVAMMPYNAPYYQQLLENTGLAKKVDLRAYKFIAGDYNDRSLKLTEAIRERLKRNNIIIRKINMNDFWNEVVKVREVYNGAWDHNTGFVPATDKEFHYLAKDLKMIVDPDFIYVAEQDGKMVGISLSIPDINQALIKIKRGRLLPFGIFKLLWYKRKIKGLRIMALGVLDGYRKMGIEACLYGLTIKTFQEKKFDYAEASWTLEHNTMVNSAIEQINGKLYRKYRIFEKSI